MWECKVGWGVWMVVAVWVDKNMGAHLVWAYPSVGARIAGLAEAAAAMAGVSQLPMAGMVPRSAQQASQERKG